MQPARKLNPAIATLIVIVLVGIVATVVVVANQKNETAVTETVQTEDTQAETQTPATTEEAGYKDGTYTETGSYFSPGGNESIEVSVTIANDVITDATVTSKAKNAESKEHQADFISGYKSLVVGKDIDEVTLSRVAGSSLTSNGFNSALELIKADAQA
ncbi:MAG: hypothetical protein V4611_00965 [Patescibacteria group bacterium]